MSTHSSWCSADEDELCVSCWEWFLESVSLNLSPLQDPHGEWLDNVRLEYLLRAAIRFFFLFFLNTERTLCSVVIFKVLEGFRGSADTRPGEPVAPGACQSRAYQYAQGPNDPWPARAGTHGNKERVCRRFSGWFCRRVIPVSFPSFYLRRCGAMYISTHYRHHAPLTRASIEARFGFVLRVLEPCELFYKYHDRTLILQPCRNPSTVLELWKPFTQQKNKILVNLLGMRRGVSSRTDLARRESQNIPGRLFQTKAWVD